MDLLNNAGKLNTKAIFATPFRRKLRCANELGLNAGQLAQAWRCQ
jgi:hypothetical protein